MYIRTIFLEESFEIKDSLKEKAKKEGKIYFELDDESIEKEIIKIKEIIKNSKNKDYYEDKILELNKNLNNDRYLKEQEILVLKYRDCLKRAIYDSMICKGENYGR